jgi:hypothetical protein
MLKHATARMQKSGVLSAKKTTTKGMKMMRSIVIEFGILKISFRIDDAMTRCFWGVFLWMRLVSAEGFLRLIFGRLKTMISA